MSRIGRVGATQIFNYATGKNIPRVDEGQALEGYQLTSERPFTNKLDDATFNVKWKFYDMTDALSDKQFLDRAKQRYNKTEYQMKIGKRSEGNRFQDAKDKPYIEYAQMGGNTFIDEAPNIETLPESQQHYLKSVIPDVEMKETKFDGAMEQVQKFDKVPTDKQKIQIDNTRPIEFIDKKLASVETYPTEEAGRTNGGSNMRLNWEKEMGQPTNLLNEKEGIERDNELSTRINFYQRGANKMRQILGLYKEKPVGQQIKETLGNVDYLNNSLNDQLEMIKQYRQKLGGTQKPKRLFNMAPLKPKEEEKKMYDKKFDTGKYRNKEKLMFDKEKMNYDKVFGIHAKKPNYGKLKLRKNPAEY